MDSEVLQVEDPAQEDGERPREEKVQPRTPRKSTMWGEQKEREPEDSWDPCSQTTNPSEPRVRAQAVTKTAFLIQVGSWMVLMGVGAAPGPLLPLPDGSSGPLTPEHPIEPYP